MQNLDHQHFKSQFDQVRSLEQKCGIAISSDVEICIAVSTLAYRFNTTFEAALSSLINELQTLAKSKTDSAVINCLVHRG